MQAMFLAGFLGYFTSDFVSFFGLNSARGWKIAKYLWVPDGQNNLILILCGLSFEIITKMLFMTSDKLFHIKK